MESAQPGSSARLPAREPLLRALVDICGPDHARVAGSADTVAGNRASFVATPATTNAVAHTMALASQRGLAVVPRGSGSKLDWGKPPPGVDLLLDTGRLDGIWHVDPSARTAEIGAGTPVRAVQAALALRGLRLPVDPPSPGATLGGMLALNEAGPLRHRYGTPAHQIEKVAYVTREGKPAESDGEEGRPGIAEIDGVLTSATVRLDALPAARRWVVIPISTPRDVALLVGETLAQSVRPSAIEVDLPAGPITRPRPPDRPTWSAYEPRPPAGGGGGASPRRGINGHGPSGGAPRPRDGGGPTLGGGINGSGGVESLRGGNGPVAAGEAPGVRAGSGVRAEVEMRAEVGVGAEAGVLTGRASGAEAGGLTGWASGAGVLAGRASGAEAGVLTGWASGAGAGVLAGRASGAEAAVLTGRALGAGAGVGAAAEGGLEAGTAVGGRGEGAAAGGVEEGAAEEGDEEARPGGESGAGDGEDAGEGEGERIAGVPVAPGVWRVVPGGGLHGALSGAGRPVAGALAVLLEGDAVDVTQRARKLALALGASAIVTPRAPEWWGRYPFAAGDVALRVTVPVAELQAAVIALSDATGLRVPLRGSAGRGAMHAVLPGTLPSRRVENILDAVRGVLLARDGRCIAISAPPEVSSTIDMAVPRDLF